MPKVHLPSTKLLVGEADYYNDSFVTTARTATPPPTSTTATETTTTQLIRSKPARYFCKFNLNLDGVAVLPKLTRLVSFLNVVSNNLQKDGPYW